MDDNGYGALGDRLRARRREAALTQEELAHLSGVSQVMIAKTEQGHRQPRLPVITRLAAALDLPLSELLDNRPRLDGRSSGASILAIRDVLLSPSLLPGIDSAGNDAEPSELPQLRAALATAGGLYWAGGFAALAALLPRVIGECRHAAQSAGAPASSLLAQAYGLTAELLVHMGKEDLAALAAERAVTAAAADADEILPAVLQGTYAWVLLHQGRLAESEKLAATVADRIRPAPAAPAEHVAAYGHLLMLAVGPAAAAGRDVSQYIAAASAAAGRIGRRVSFYQASFAPATVHMQACYAYAVTGQPAKAVTAARKIHPGDLAGISYGRHLLDVAQAHADARQHAAATAALSRARALSPVWFRHQGIARSLVAELTEQQKRLSPALRELAASVDPNWYAPYYRHR
jgi:transcriptional regulator with XRE-family HTH domain